MFKTAKIFVILFGLGVLFTSCKKEIYHSFTDEERAFMVYELGDTFRLKNDTTGDTLEFVVTSKDVHYNEDFGPKFTVSRKVHYMEEGRVEFSGVNNSGSGYIYIYKDKINQFILSVKFRYGNGSFGDSGGGIIF